MPNLIYVGKQPSYTVAENRFLRSDQPDEKRNADGSYSVADEAVAEYLMSTRMFEHAPKAGTSAAKATGGNARKGGVSIGGKPVEDAAEKEEPKPTFPANGFRDKRSLQTFARKHLGYEADLNKALKTLNAEASEAFDKKFVAPAEAAAEENPADLGMDEDDGIDTANDTTGMIDGTETGGDLEDDNA